MKKMNLEFSVLCSYCNDSLQQVLALTIEVIFRIEAKRLTYNQRYETTAPYIYRQCSINLQLQGIK